MDVLIRQSCAYKNYFMSRFISFSDRITHIYRFRGVFTVWQNSFAAVYCSRNLGVHQTRIFTSMMLTVGDKPAIKAYFPNNNRAYTRPFEGVHEIEWRNLPSTCPSQYRRPYAVKLAETHDISTAAVRYSSLNF